MLGKVNRAYFNGNNPFHKKVDFKETLIVRLIFIAASLAICSQPSYLIYTW